MQDRDEAIAAREQAAQDRETAVGRGALYFQDLRKAMRQTIFTGQAERDSLERFACRY